MERIILDTDIGSDIDDSFALTYLLNNDACEIVGISTCTGEARKRAQLCDYFTTKAKKNKIEICVGSDDPLKLANKQTINHQPECPQAAVLTKYDVASKEYQTNPAKFLREYIMNVDGDVTVVAIGPLTNIALAITEFPEIISKLKRLVLMGGKIDTSESKKGLVDWNFICDPQAAEIVLSAPFKEVVIYPCDVTYSLNHSKAYMHENLKGKYSDIIKDMADIWFERFNEYSYHDPMAAMYVFHPEMVNGERGKLSVDLKKCSSDLGMTSWQSRENGNHFIVTSIKKDEFLEELYATINR
ncbi:MAG: nucleoside hydrolase [Anaerorhabdus sp.]|uniref:nucleoside hydrolase n=1 Tax=Anaerorhabdus sp. TaxID=1872524 RepID=UPI002FCC3AB8